jgi:hypothetical protein
VPDEQRAHVLRPPLPWREASSVLTECGLHPATGMPVLTVPGFVAMVKHLGQQRASLQVCMTCWHTAVRHNIVSWESDPVGVMAREVSWARTHLPGVVRDDPTARLFRDEMLAVAELITRHRDEFAELVAGLAEAPRLADRRRNRRRSAS